jgi:hypothetical protein
LFLLFLLFLIQFISDSLLVDVLHLFYKQICEL